MSKKPKFNPEITKVNLNPEQAVLACSCYNNGTRISSYSYMPTSTGWCYRHQRIWGYTLDYVEDEDGRS